jgi:hypothetical protein
MVSQHCTRPPVRNHDSLITILYGYLGGKISTTLITPAPTFTVKIPISTPPPFCCGTNTLHLTTTLVFQQKIAVLLNSLPKTLFPTRLVTSFSSLLLLDFHGLTLRFCTPSRRAPSTNQPSSISLNAPLSLFTGPSSAPLPISGSIALSTGLFSSS